MWIYYHLGAGRRCPYFDVGTLYSLGLVHANHGECIKTFLLNILKMATEEVLNCYIPNSNTFGCLINI